MRIYRFSVIIEEDRDGYFAFCPELQGCSFNGRRIRGVNEIIQSGNCPAKRCACSSCGH